jgi:hypothetical protein
VTTRVIVVGCEKFILDCGHILKVEQIGSGDSLCVVSEKLPRMTLRFLGRNN